MRKLSASDKIYVSESKISSAGRGVFAKCNIKKGEIIEKCPIIEIPIGDTSKLYESFLVTYFLYFGKTKERLCIMLGFGSIYNHSETPNSNFKIYPKKEIVEFIALKNIKKDEEITFDYRHGNKIENPLWFENRQ
ncbi:MAG: SET domain-containing protein-lysine N-methyltransferase [Candidatus Woesebacteria bacterium]|nr:MAG: SET domain-containing protein-lysine N-methyltransferase [Candidatus Woesebacteria bacterium]